MRTGTLLAALAALAMQTAAARADCAGDEKLVRFSHVVTATGHPKGEAATRLAERVNREMDGKLCMEVYPDASLYREDEAIRALVSGELELAAPSTARFGEFTKRLHLFELPFLFRSEAALAAFIDSDAGRDLLSSMEEDGLVGLSFWLAGFKHISANRPLLTPADAVGLTFRVPDTELSVNMIEALGAKAKVMEIGDVRAALESGEVDGHDNTWSNILTQNLYQSQAGITESWHQALMYLVATSRQFLDSLDPATRAQFLQIVAEVTAETNRGVAQMEADNRAALIAAGVEIRMLDEDQRQQWIEAMQPVWERFEESIGRDAIEAARNAGH